MKLELYREILSLMRSYRTRKCLKAVSEKFPGISYSTLGSIFAQDYQRKMKKTHHKHYNAEVIQGYYHRFCLCVQNEDGDGVLVRLADEVDLSPALLARMIVEQYLVETKYCEKSPPRSEVSQLMKNTTLIEDPRLSHEVHMCILSDDIYGPLSDTVKHSVGHEHELLLFRNAKDKGLVYLDEDQMREKGYDKTPDMKLEIPIAVNGYVINWIESKASFGDEESHKTYLKDQFWSYWNRFGPGLVIYWFGFIDELDVNRDKGILLMDHFPETFVTMNPQAVNPLSR